MDICTIHSFIRFNVTKRDTMSCVNKCCRLILRRLAQGFPRTPRQSDALHVGRNCGPLSEPSGQRRKRRNDLNRNFCIHWLVS